jgi:hypothetical protein
MKKLFGRLSFKKRRGDKDGARRKSSGSEKGFEEESFHEEKSENNNITARKDAPDLVEDSSSTKEPEYYSSDDEDLQIELPSPGSGLSLSRQTVMNFSDPEVRKMLELPISQSHQRQIQSPKEQEVDISL